MPTENPKISLYVPQHIYDRFIEYKEESGLSMSQAGTVLLAQYFGIEDTIKDIAEGVTVGGVTLDRVEKIEDEIKQLKEQIKNLVNHKEAVSEPLAQNTKIKHYQPLLDIANLHPTEILFDNKQLAKRLSVSSSKISSNKGKLTHDSFLSWIKEADPDGIEWDFQNKISGRGVNYFPVSNTPSELLSKLQEWMVSNGVKSEGKVP